MVSELSRQGTWNPSITHIFVLQVLEQLQLTVCPLREHRCAKRLHDLLDGDILTGKLILGRAICSMSMPYLRLVPTCFQRTRQDQKLPCPPVADQSTYRIASARPYTLGKPTLAVSRLPGTRPDSEQSRRTSTHLDVISKVVPKI